jgi:hypothetical protein
MVQKWCRQQPCPSGKTWNPINRLTQAFNEKPTKNTELQRLRTEYGVAWIMCICWDEMIVHGLENYYLPHHAHKKEKKNLVKFQFLPSYRGSSDIYLLLLHLMVNFSFYLFFEELLGEK